MSGGASPKRGGPPRRSGAGGFTLVELMIVVAIIGTLATIGIPTFLNMRDRARVAEAKANLGAIRVVQFAYFAEHSLYVGSQDWTPDRTADPAGRLPWDPDTRFSVLGYSAEGKVYFSYALAGPAFAGSFTASARGDLDLDGAWSVWETSSTSKEFTHSGGLL